MKKKGMKKKGMSIVALVAVMAMTTISLTGCGTQARATDVQISEENLDETTIIVTDSDATESDNSEVTSTEVIGGTEADAGVFAGAENEDIVLYADKGVAQYVPLENSTFEDADIAFAAKEEIPLFNGNGEEVGYVKKDGNVNVTESDTVYNWARFENPIAGTDYDYLYINKDYLPDENAVYVTAEDIKPMIIDLVNNRAYELPNILDAPTDDMEVHEFVLAKEYKSQLHLEDAVTRGYSDDYSGGAMGYMTYYIECEEETNIIRCKIYYKDKYVNPNLR